MTELDLRLEYHQDTGYFPLRKNDNSLTSDL